MIISIKWVCFTVKKTHKADITKISTQSSPKVHIQSMQKRMNTPSKRSRHKKARVSHERPSSSPRIHKPKKNQDAVINAATVVPVPPWLAASRWPTKTWLGVLPPTSNSGLAGFSPQKNRITTCITHIMQVWSLLALHYDDFRSGGSPQHPII